MKNFIIKIGRTIVGLISLPFLYTRYSFIFFIPLLFTPDVMLSGVAFLWFIYTNIFGFLMGNLGLMKHWTKLFQWMFKVEYEVVGQWGSNAMYSYSVWSYPTIKVRGKDYNLTVAVMGGNLYDEEDNIRRKAIVYWLFN